MSPAARPFASLGLASLARLVFEGRDVQSVWTGLVERMAADPADAGAMFDASMLLQLTGNRDQGLELQASALTLGRVYRTVHGRGGVRVLAFARAGDFMANTPLDFLLEGADAELTTLYVDDALPSPADCPDHDVAFLAIGQSDSDNHALLAMGRTFGSWPRPVMNGRPGLIASLSRDGVAAMFAGSETIIAPATCLAAQAALDGVRSSDDLRQLEPDLAFPVIVRPTGSHAGSGLEKIDDAEALAAYLATRGEAQFFATRFVDYSGPDGKFRKFRIVLVDGRAFVAHMAVSARWMVHYLNADMADDAGNRAEEAEVMAGFDDGFARRHARAFAEMHAAFGLDYFGIDCAETQDGRLLLFEADVAMIVHAMDPPDLYPYKKPAMARLFAAFVGAVEGRVDDFGATAAEARAGGSGSGP